MMLPSQTHLVLKSHLEHAVCLVQHEVLNRPQVETLDLRKVMQQAAWGRGEYDSAPPWMTSVLTSTCSGNSPSTSQPIPPEIPLHV